VLPIKSTLRLSVSFLSLRHFGHATNSPSHNSQKSARKWGQEYDVDSSFSCPHLLAKIIQHWNSSFAAKIAECCQSNQLCVLTAYFPSLRHFGHATDSPSHNRSKIGKKMGARI
jgi:hypothetical protein